MFKNIGGKIKTLAKVLFIISVIVFALSAAVAAIYVGRMTAYSCGGYAYHSSSRNGVAGFFAGLGTFIVGAGVGFLISWIGSFFMYGLGQLIEDTEINRKTNQEILKKLQSAPEQPKAPEQPAGWVCAKCGTVNTDESNFCYNCGTRK